MPSLQIVLGILHVPLTEPWGIEALLHARKTWDLVPLKTQVGWGARRGCWREWVSRQLSRSLICVWGVL